MWLVHVGPGAREGTTSVAVAEPSGEPKGNLCGHSGGSELSSLTRPGSAAPHASWARPGQAFPPAGTRHGSRDPRPPPAPAATLQGPGPMSAPPFRGQSLRLFPMMRMPRRCQDAGGQPGGEGPCSQPRSFIPLLCRETPSPQTLLVLEPRTQAQTTPALNLSDPVGPGASTSKRFRLSADTHHGGHTGSVWTHPR